MCGLRMGGGGGGGEVVRQWNLFAFELLWGVGFTLIIATGIYFPSCKAQCLKKIRRWEKTQAYWMKERMYEQTNG